MIVLTPGKLVKGDDNIYRPGLSSGSAHGLALSEIEKAAIGEKERIPFGFRAPTPAKRKRKKRA